MLNYSISFDNPLSQIVKISLEVPANGSYPVQFKLSNWRPGRYQIQNFAKRIKRIAVFDDQNKTLSILKVDKSTWQVEPQGSNAIKISYEYHAAAMDAGNSWLDNEQLYLNFINCMLYVDEHLENPCSVKLELPETYNIACGLEKTDKHELSSPSFYRLVDSPMFASANLRCIPFSNSGVQFNLWIQGSLEVSDEQLINDFNAYTSKQIEVMGPFPCDEYHYLFQILPYKHYHGVEHWNSTVITLGPSEHFQKREGYLDLLGVSSHELFHTWNVIRMRPKEMTPYNFEGENYHFTGYITEGVTTYYGDLFLARSGVFSLDEYLAELNKMLKRHYENEGRHNLSVADSSFDLWLDGYEKGVPGRKVSIYNEGALAALILDLTIRLKWENEKSLDDVMRLLWAEFGVDQSGYEAVDYQEAAETIFGETLSEYFGSILYGNTSYELKLKPLLEVFGLNFELKNSNKAEERDFGFRLMQHKVSDIASGSPAFEGLMIGDEINSVNGVALKDAQLEEETLELEIKRFGRPLFVELNKSESNHFSIYQVAHNESNELQKGWLEDCVK